MFDPHGFRSGLRFHSSGSDKGWKAGPFGQDANHMATATLHGWEGGPETTAGFGQNMCVMFDPHCFRSGLRFHSSGSDNGWKAGPFGQDANHMATATLQLL